MAMLNHILLVSRNLEIFYDKDHHYVTYHYYLYITGVGVAYMVLNGLVCIYYNVIITMSLITTIFTLQVWAWPTWCSMGWCVSTTTSSSLCHLSLLSLHYRCGRGLHGAQWAGVYLLRHHHYVTYQYYLYITGVGVAYMVLNGLVCIYYNVIIAMSLITTISTLQVWAWPTWCSMGWCVSTTTSSSPCHYTTSSPHSHRISPGEAADMSGTRLPAAILSGQEMPVRLENYWPTSDINLNVSRFILQLSFDQSIGARY